MSRYPNRITLLTAFLIVLGLLSGCATTKSINDDDLAVYINESPAFIVKYPKTWVTRPIQGSEVLSVCQTFSTKRLPAMNVSVSDVPEEYELIDLPEETVNMLKKSMPWASHINKSTTDIKLNDGSRAVASMYSWEWKSKGIPFFAFQVAAMKDHKLVSTFAMDARYDSVLKKLKRYAGSLEFLEAEGADSHSDEKVFETTEIYEKDLDEEIVPHVEEKKNAIKKKTTKPQFNISMPLSKMTSNDLKKLLISENARKKMASGISTPDGKVEVKGVLMKKRAIQLCEIIEDVEALEKYDPDYVSDLPDTGFVVQNDTDRRVTMKIKGNADKTMAVSAGESSAVALPEGTYEYSFSSDKGGSLKAFSGEKTILKKCRYLFKFYLKD